MKIYNNIFEKIISLENLFSAWDTFKSDKQKKKDVRRFEWQLEENIFELYRDLKSRNYIHGDYTSFYITDPKQRIIHKALVRDRILHHAIFSVLTPLFEETFIQNSFSCRINKGTHKGITALNTITRKISGNGFKPCFALKCDIKKFFASVNRSILLRIIKKRIKDQNAIWLVTEIIESFTSKESIFERKGLPIGNLTSQLFANIYLNEFDQFMKHKLKVKHYIRYTDDFVIVSNNKTYLENLIPIIQSFLFKELTLTLHPGKITIRKLYQGIDFLGSVLFPYHRQIRTKTKRRIIKKLKERIKQYKNGIIEKQTLEQSLQSYLGVLCHANTHKLSNELKNQFWFWMTEN